MGVGNFREYSADRVAILVTDNVPKYSRSVVFRTPFFKGVSENQALGDNEIILEIATLP